MSKSIESIPLGDVCERVTVGHVGKTSEFYTDNGGVEFLRTQNVGLREIVRKDVRRITCEFHNKLAKSTLREGDVLLSRVISDKVNCAVVPADLDGANCANVIVVRPGADLDSNYLVYFITSPLAQRALLRRRVGSAQSVVNTKVVQSWEIPLPRLSEQKRIAGILDKADSIVRKRQQAIGLTEQFLRSTFLDMFGDPVTNPKGWPVVLMKELFAIPPNYGSMVVPNDEDGEYLDLRVANIQGGELDLSSRKYVDLEPKLVPRHEVLDGDILLARAIGSREHLGKCFVAHPGEEKWAFDSHLMRLRLNLEKTLPQFIRSYLASPGGRHKFLKHTRRSAVQYNVNTKEIAKVEVPLPPIEKQREYLKLLQKVRSTEKHLDQDDAELTNLFNSLVQRAFRGEL